MRYFAIVLYFAIFHDIVLYFVIYCDTFAIFVNRKTTYQVEFYSSDYRMGLETEEVQQWHKRGCCTETDARPELTENCVGELRYDRFVGVGNTQHLVFIEGDEPSILTPDAPKYHMMSWLTKILIF